MAHLDAWIGVGRAQPAGLGASAAAGDRRTMRARGPERGRWITRNAPLRGDRGIGRRGGARSRARRGDDRFAHEGALLAGYLGCAIVVALMLPLGGRLEWGEAGPALGLQLVVAGLLALGIRSRRVPSPIAMIGLALYLTSVALLRDAAPPTAGYGPLVLLPVIWAALRGRRGELCAAIAGVACIYLVPEVVVGGSHYPSGGWRAGLLFVVLSAVLGVSVLRLLTRVRELVARLDGLAQTDELTGVLNRRAWEERLEQELVEAGRSELPLTIALLDLDRFKEYNDTHGHLAGDRLLIHAAAAWQAVLREGDAIARWGGDEFGLILSRCTAANARSLLERLRAACPEVAFSAGLAEWDGQGAPDALVRAADDALYEHKRARVSSAAV